MKIIQEGSKKPWWVGLHVECACCGQVVEFEEGDLASSIIQNMGDKISYWCRKCDMWNYDIGHGAEKPDYSHQTNMLAAAGWMETEHSRTITRRLQGEQS